MNNLLLFTLFFLFRNLNPILSLSPDGLSLLSLKLAVDLPAGHDSPFTDWNKNDATPCRWSGISCMNITGFPDPRVVGITIFAFNATLRHSLFLYDNNLSGSLPPLICNLPMLQNLDLSNNSLSGSLPENLKNCKRKLCSCACINGFQNEDSENEEHEKGERSTKGEGKLVVIDKGFNIELDELPRASAYVLGKSGLGIVYKMVLGNGVPVAVRRLGEGGSDQQRYREFAAEV
ncbi:hypothetical protein Gohar_005053 [Gossypium harknessii]|uniref:Leucine-rich repeat-containing N-terminal plant-type domain-containing protein n=1 Tax=Gossypium harknessii TaxID=34285 RepID=A0A7J9H6W2_9ROSI|nr:hypothetical protein [Gossypium harknessii]